MSYVNATGLEIKIWFSLSGDGTVVRNSKRASANVAWNGGWTSRASKEAYSSLCYKHHTATGTHMPHGITQYYLPPGRGDIPAITPAN